MSKFTPGPWSINEKHPGDIMGSDGRDVATTWLAENRDEKTEEANARLIAASPDLLEALKFFLERHLELVYSGDCGNWDPDSDPEVVQARAAIAKAEGN